MATIMPDSENIRKAVKWVGEVRRDNPQAKPAALVEDASVRFALSPAESEYLDRLVREKIGQ